MYISFLLSLPPRLLPSLQIATECRAGLSVTWQPPTSYLFYMVVYTCQCCFLNLFYSPLPPQGTFVPSLQIDSSVLFFQIPYICALISDIRFSFSDFTLYIQALGSSTSLQLTQIYTFLWLSNILLYSYDTSSIHSSFDEHLGCFHVLAIVNSAAMNIGVHVSFSIVVFSGYTPSSGIAGSYGDFYNFKDYWSGLLQVASLLGFVFLTIVLLCSSLCHV